ncbi:MAG: NUDIX domain-containing protein [Bacteroidota bacterium]
MPPQLLIKARAIISDGHQLLMCWEKRIQKWMLPGGTLEPGENLQACLARELQEELALDVAIGPLLGCLEWHRQDQGRGYQEFDFIFKVVPPLGLLDNPVIANEDHIEFETVPIAALSTMANVVPPGIAAWVAQEYHKEGIYSFVAQDQ